MTQNKPTLLLSHFLDPTFKYLFELQGFRVLHSETYGGIEKLIEANRSEIDLAIEWQRGQDAFPIRDLLKKLRVDAPVLLSLNWNHRIPENFGQLGFAGTLNVPHDTEELLGVCRRVLAEEKFKMLEI